MSASEELGDTSTAEARRPHTRSLRQEHPGQEEESPPHLAVNISQNSVLGRRGAAGIPGVSEGSHTDLPTLALRSRGGTADQKARGTQRGALNCVASGQQLEGQPPQFQCCALPHTAYRHRWHKRESVLNWQTLLALHWPLLEALPHPSYALPPAAPHRQPALACAADFPKNSQKSLRPRQAVTGLGVPVPLAEGPQAQRDGSGINSSMASTICLWAQHGQPPTIGHFIAPTTGQAQTAAGLGHHQSLS